jgi:hypothetical protein
MDFISIHYYSELLDKVLSYKENHPNCSFKITSFDDVCSRTRNLELLVYNPRNKLVHEATFTIGLTALRLDPGLMNFFASNQGIQDFLARLNPALNPPQLN